MASRRVISASFLAGALLLGERAAADTQLFKDDGGRVIYTIEDDGTVTMYEKSPADKTISMKQGTREEMQPRVTGITPDSVRAGTDTVVRFEGRNLVGAKVKASIASVELGPYAGKPDTLDIPLRIPTTVPAGDLIFEVTTPIGSAKAKLKIVELQIGGGSAKRDVEKFSKAAPTACPQGTIGVGAEFGGFCIEIDRTFSGDLRAAEKSCAISGRRLCQALEWQHACEQAKAGSIPLKNMVGVWEWTGSADTTGDVGQEDSTEVRYILLGKENCQNKLISPRWKPDAYAGRCCK
jgi:hypothetical protein